MSQLQAVRIERFKAIGDAPFDVLRALEIVLAAYRSGEDHERRWVELTEP